MWRLERSFFLGEEVEGECHAAEVATPPAIAVRHFVKWKKNYAAAFSKQQQQLQLVPETEFAYLPGFTFIGLRHKHGPVLWTRFEAWSDQCSNSTTFVMHHTRSSSISIRMLHDSLVRFIGFSDFATTLETWRAFYGIWNSIALVSELNRKPLGRSSHKFDVPKFAHESKICQLQWKHLHEKHFLFLW